MIFKFLFGLIIFFTGVYFPFFMQIIPEDIKPNQGLAIYIIVILIGAISVLFIYITRLHTQYRKDAKEHTERYEKLANNINDVVIENTRETTSLKNVQEELSRLIRSKL